MKNLFLITCLILLFSCSQKVEEISTKVEGDSLEAQMIEATEKRKDWKGRVDEKINNWWYFTKLL